MSALLLRLDHFQQRHPALGLPYAVHKRFGEHDGGRLAATLSYYCFFSVFPLLLVFVTVLSIVLEDNDDLRQQLLDGALGQIPVLGSELADGQTTIQGSGWILALGIITALWAGLGAAAALQQALDDLFDVPVHERPNFAMKKARSVAFLFLFAVCVTLSTLSSNVATLFDVGPFAGGLGLLVTGVVDAVLLLMMFSVLPSRRHPVADLLPGVIVGAVGLVTLQQLGSFVVRRYIAGASDTYGTFAIVIALLSWFALISRLLLLAAQLNAVVADGLSPRRLVATGPSTDADRLAAMLDVHRIQRDVTLGYALSVEGDVATNEDPTGSAATAAADDQPATSR